MQSRLLEKKLMVGFTGNVRGSKRCEVLYFKELLLYKRLLLFRIRLNPHDTYSLVLISLDPTNLQLLLLTYWKVTQALKETADRTTRE